MKISLEVRKRSLDVRKYHSRLVKDRFIIATEGSEFFKHMAHHSILLVWSANGDAPFQGKFQVNLLNDDTYRWNCVTLSYGLIE